MIVKANGFYTVDTDWTWPTDDLDELERAWQQRPVPLSDPHYLRDAELDEDGFLKYVNIAGDVYYFIPDDPSRWYLTPTVGDQVSGMPSISRGENRTHKHQ